MKQHSVRINSEEGLQARNTTALVRHALGYDCDIMIGKEGRWVDGKSLMGMMHLHGRKHEWLTLVTNGKEEAAAIDALIAFLTTASPPPRRQTIVVLPNAFSVRFTRDKKT